MKKNLAILPIVLVFVLMAFGTSTAWQGRMAGMGDPYGLVQDESDMLIHPAMIMNSSGFRFYTHYRFTYTDVMDWDYQWDFNNGAGVKFDFDFDASGDEFKHEALIGSTFNLGAGRMGAFFAYDNINGDYDGDLDVSNAIPFPNQDFDLDSDKQDFTLSLLYGFPINCTDIGVEAGFAYHDEENKIKQDAAGLDITNNLFPNLLFPVINFWSNLYPYMIPYDSDYFETFMKASVASELGCAADFAFTLNGGYIFSGDNELDSSGDVVAATSIDADMDGDVDGWSLGGDFWLRHKIDNTITLPFLISANYKEIDRDGDDGSVSIGATPVDLDYKHTEESWDIQAGGGVDISMDKSSKIASGLYYQYIKSKNDFMLDIGLPVGSINVDMDDIPDYTEHRITLKIAYEKEFSKTIGFRAGFDVFLGKTDWDYDNTFTQAGVDFIENVSLDGDIWGLGLALGSTINVNPVTLEPFIGFAYQRLHLDGDGRLSIFGTKIDINGDYEKDQWMLTTGTSILF